MRARAVNCCFFGGGVFTCVEFLLDWMVCWPGLCKKNKPQIASRKSWWKDGSGARVDPINFWDGSTFFNNKKQGLSGNNVWILVNMHQAYLVWFSIFSMAILVSMNVRWCRYRCNSRWSRFGCFLRGTFWLQGKSLIWVQAWLKQRRLLRMAEVCALPSEMCFYFFREHFCFHRSQIHSLDVFP